MSSPHWSSPNPCVKSLPRSLLYAFAMSFWLRANLCELVLHLQELRVSPIRSSSSSASSCTRSPR